MINNESADSDGLPSQPSRKMWSTPVVTFLSIDETANNVAAQSDGLGSSTGS